MSQRHDSSCLDGDSDTILHLSENDSCTTERAARVTFNIEKKKLIIPIEAEAYSCDNKHTQ
jgi:hypothetical protein